MKGIALDNQIAGAHLDLLRVDQERELSVENVAVGDASRLMEADAVLEIGLRVFRRRNCRHEASTLTGHMRQPPRLAWRRLSNRLIWLRGPESADFRHLIADDVRLAFSVTPAYHATHAARRNRSL